jgi:hypothetical protein
MPDVISGQNTALILIGQAAYIIGYVALLQFYAPRLGRFGNVALRLFRWGGIILATGHVGFISALGAIMPPSIAALAESLFLLILVRMPLSITDLIWLGFINLRQPVLARWQWLPLLRHS